MSNPSPPPQRDDPAGIFYAAFAYVMWGVMPLYWRLLGTMSAFELTAHRIFWSAIFAAGVAIARGQVGKIIAIMRKPKVLGMLALTGLLITANWTTYIYTIESHQLVEASLGYYINPLVSIALGAVFLGEHLSKLRLAAIALASVAVLVQTFELGHFPFIAIILALSFGFYGYFRKLAPVDALDGFTVEVFVLFPFVAAFIGFLAVNGTGVFPKAGAFDDAILIVGGPLTAIPLVMFAAGARRIRLSTLGFLQYLCPSIMLLLAILGFGEKFTLVHAWTFGAIWAALLLVAIDGQLSRVRPVKPVVE
ncbi:MAG TPA: EamA family transporter RarD [Rhizomicrobium sp.]|jgi:chloramphenicol-sensitive protein RarD|nr:EamA family transporter RarD [Rhizomicrobium sp.]